MQVRTSMTTMISRMCLVEYFEDIYSLWKTIWQTWNIISFQMLEIICPFWQLVFFNVQQHRKEKRKTWVFVNRCEWELEKTNLFSITLAISYECSTSEILGLISWCSTKNIKKLKNHHMFSNFEITINSQRQDPLPIHIHTTQVDLFLVIWETKTCVQLVPFSKKNPNLCPFNSFHHAKCGYMCDASWLFHHVKKRWLHVWNFTTLRDSL